MSWKRKLKQAQAEESKNPDLGRPPVKLTEQDLEKAVPFCEKFLNFKPTSYQRDLL